MGGVLCGGVCGRRHRAGDLDPHSYRGCGQRGPNEHGPGSLFSEGLVVGYRPTQL